MSNAAWFQEEVERELVEAEEAEQLKMTREKTRTTVVTADGTKLALPIKPLRGGNGMTEEQKAATLAAAGRRKDDVEYLQTWTEGVEEFRRRFQEDYERELAEEDGK